MATDFTPAELRRIADILESNDDQPGFDFASAVAAMEAEDMDATATCKHCERTIVQENGAWIDPEATGDDEMWRESCESHDTFPAEHEPTDKED